MPPSRPSACEKRHERSNDNPCTRNPCGCLCPPKRILSQFVGGVPSEWAHHLRFNPEGGHRELASICPLRAKADACPVIMTVTASQHACEQTEDSESMTARTGLKNRR